MKPQQENSGLPRLPIAVGLYLLAFALASRAAVIGDYSTDFRTGGFPSNWRYMWNKPTGWSASPDNRTGGIGNPSSYANLVPSGSIYTPDGDSNFSNNSPAAYLQLSSSGGHPGANAGAAGVKDRYAIAAFTVPAAGYHKITNSRVRGVSGGTGLHLVAHTGSNPAAVELRTTADTQESFDTLLGFLPAGETIYVAVGPDGNSSSDSFTLDFTVETYDPATTVIGAPLASRYSRAFTGTPEQTKGWSLLWNGPVGWVAGGSGGSTASGGIASGSGYLPLVNTGNSRTPDGDTNPANNFPSGGLRMDAAGGTPGPAGSDGSMSRYAIAQYEAPLAGKYLIGQSFLELGGASADGVEVMVLVNGVRKYTATIAPGQRGRFDGETGSLSAGDKVQVAVGPRGNDTGDAFTWDFEITHAEGWFDAAVQELNVASFGAVGNGSTDDGPAIRAAINAAAASGVPTRIAFDGTKTYRITSFTGDYAMDFASKENIRLMGNGATLSILAPKRVASLYRSRNIRIEGFTVIFNPLPYFQADVVGYNPSAKTLDIKVLNGYPMPPVDAPGVADNSATWSFGHSYGHDPSSQHVWIRTIKEIDAANTANRTLRLTAQDQSAGAVTLIGSDDASFGGVGMIIANPGYGQTGNYIVKIRESSHVLFKDLVIRQAPEFVFLAYGNDGPVRFANVDIKVPAGSQERFVSWRDGFHVKDNRYGPIWEDCDFDGWAMQDDLFNLTAVWMYVNLVNAGTPRWITLNHPGTEGNPWRAGDWVTAQQLNGTVKGSAKLLSCVVADSLIYCELDRAIPGLAAGDRLIDDLASNRGSVIRRCATSTGDAGNSSWRQRTPILVEDNDFEDVTLLIEAESGSEGPVPQDMVFRRNRMVAQYWNAEIISLGYDINQRGLHGFVFQDNTFDEGYVRFKNSSDLGWYFNDTLPAPGQSKSLYMNNAGVTTCIGNTVNGGTPANYLDQISYDAGTVPANDIVFKTALVLSAAFANGQVTLNWTPSPDAVSYKVLRATSVAGPYTEIANVGYDMTYLDSMANGTAHYYKITALTATGAATTSSAVVVDTRLFWDGADTVTAGAQGGSGTWNSNLTANWVGTTGNVVWPAPGGTGDAAVFSGNAGTVSISGGVAANMIEFTTNGYTLQGSTLTLNGTTPTITVGSSLNATISSTVGGTAGLAKSGPGLLVLSGTNNYSGITSVNQGTLVVANAAGLGSTADGTNVASGAELYFQNSLTYAAEPISLAGNGSGAGALHQGGGSTITLPGTITLGGDATIKQDGGTTMNLTGGIALGNSSLNLLNDGGANMNINSALTGSGSVTKSGGGTARLAGANTYAGATVISAGILRLGAGSVIPDGPGKGDLTVNATLDLNTFSEAINGLSGTGTIDTVAGGSPVLTVGSNDQASTFSGLIKNTAGTLSLAKAGTNSLSLGGTNTYGGATTVEAGLLEITNPSALGSASSGTSIRSGARLFLYGLPNGSTLAEPLDLAGDGNGEGAIRQGGGKTNTLSGAISLGGNTMIRSDGGATIHLTHPSGITGAGATLTFQNDGGSNINVSGPVALGSGGVTKTGGGTVTLSGANTYSGDTLVALGRLGVTGANFSDISEVTVGLAPGASAILELNFTGTDIVASLVVDGTTLPAGTYDAATHPADIAGRGRIQVVPGNTFPTWAVSKGLNGSAGREAGFNDDPDQDAIANGLEWILGGDPLRHDAADIMPVADGDSSTGLVFSFNRNDSSISGSTLIFQWSPNLMSPWIDVPISETAAGTYQHSSGVTVVVANNGASPDTVTVTVPASNGPGGRMFGRLAGNPG